MVMIILAGTVIISLNNSGIIKKANVAVDNNNEMEIKRAAELVYGEYIMDKPAVSDLGGYLTEKLVENGTINGVTDYYIKVIDKKIAVIKVGSLVDEYYKGQLKTGDYVGYNAGENTITVNEYTAKFGVNTMLTDEVTITSSSNLKWRVLGAENSKFNNKKQQKQYCF